LCAMIPPHDHPPTGYCPTSCGSGFNRCCPLRPPTPAVARLAPSPTALALPRSSSWPAPPPVGAAAGRRFRLRRRDQLWRWFAEWAAAGVFERLQEDLLNELGTGRWAPLPRLPARRGIKGGIARRGIESSTRLGRHRWKAERTIAWLAGCLRLHPLRPGLRAVLRLRHAGLRTVGYNRLPGTAEAHARSP
jgi:hypothetical protein